MAPRYRAVQRGSGIQAYCRLSAAPARLLQVNNQRTAIPYKPSDRLQVTLRGHRLYLITDFEMVVTFDGGKNAGTCEWGGESRGDAPALGQGKPHRRRASHGEEPRGSPGPPVPGEQPGAAGRSGRASLLDTLPPAVITLPNKYKGLVRGLCGNFDGNKSNDFILPNGTITQNLVTFGNSWEVQRITGVNLARFSR